MTRTSDGRASLAALLGGERAPAPLDVRALDGYGRPVAARQMIAGAARRSESDAGLRGRKVRAPQGRVPGNAR